MFEQLRPKVLTRQGGDRRIVPCCRLDPAGSSDGCLPRLAALDRSGRQVHPGRPPLEVGRDPRDLVGRNVEVDGSHDSSRLFGIEHELADTDDHEPTISDESRHRQPPCGPTHEDELRPWRDVASEGEDGIGPVGVGDAIKVIKDQVDAADRRDGGTQPRDSGRPDRRSCGRDRGSDLGRERRDRVECHVKVIQEQVRVVVARVERQPRDRTLIPRHPLGHRRRLPVPGRRDHDDDGRGHARQRRRQRGSLDDPWPLGRWYQLGHQGRQAGRHHELFRLRSFDGRQGSPA